MYVHDLIEATKKGDLVKAFDKDNLKPDIYPIRLQSLRESTHFFIGDAFEVIKMIERKEYIGIDLFTGVLGENIRMPYNLCCFVYKTDIDTIGGKIDAIVLCIKQEERDDAGDNEIGFFYDIYCRMSRGSWFLMTETPLYCSNKRVMLGFNEHLNHFDGKKMANITMTLINYTLMFLNCKNIVSEKNLPPAKLNKKRIKNKKQPLFSYYTLKLKLPNKRAASDGEPAFTGNTVRLHFCRGHFKTYTKEKPLFGKHTGRYWCQAHARGDETKGKIKKDYELKAA